MISHKFSSPVLAFVTLLCFICNSAYCSLLDQETIFIRAPARPLFAGCFFFFSWLSHRIILTLIHHLEYFIPSFSCYPSFFFTLSFSFFFSIFYFLWLNVFFFLFRRCWIHLCTCNLCINKTPFNTVRSLHRFIAI